MEVKTENLKEIKIQLEADIETLRAMEAETNINLDEKIDELYEEL